MEASGRFIVFEGIDGAGKTTQVELLAQNLRSLGREVSLSAEPTTLESGRAIRRALSGAEKKSECQMAAMFVLDRIAHNIDSEIGIRALTEKGIDVISDRYYYSSLAYQGAATDYGWVKQMNIGSPEIRRPDLCIYLDLLPEQSLERIRADCRIRVGTRRNHKSRLLACDAFVDEAAAHERIVETHLKLHKFGAALRTYCGERSSRSVGNRLTRIASV